MAELVQLDKAAALVGKSEVTLRRLIKAEKIPFKKEKTLTGFVYLVDPNAVRKFYKMKPVAAQPAETKVTPTPVESEEATSHSGVRIAVAGESGSVSEYWQKKSDLYEERYREELVKHANTREELGVWRGRAEQTQAMLMKLLPAPQEVAVGNNVPEQGVAPKSSQALTVVSLIILMVLVAALGAVVYIKLF